MISVILKRKDAPYWTEEFDSMDAAKSWLESAQKQANWEECCTYEIVDHSAEEVVQKQADAQKQATLDEAAQVKQDLKTSLLKQIQSYRDTEKKDLEILSAMANVMADFILLGG